MDTRFRMKEFVRGVKTFEQSYITVRLRTLFADRGNGLEAATTVCHLLPDEYEERETILWSSKLLKIVERFMSYRSIDTILDSIHSDELQLDSIYIGFNDDEEPHWDYNVISRDEQFSRMKADSTTLLLSGHVTIKDSPHGYETRFANEMKLNPLLPVSSLRELTRRILQYEVNDLQHKSVDIVAPSCVWLMDLSYRGDRIGTQFRCMKQYVSRIRMKSMFYHQNGDITVFQPRLRDYSLREIGGDLVEISKDFIVPPDVSEAEGVSLTLSLDSKLGLDTEYAPNLSVINPVWHVLSLLDESKVGKYFRMHDFERRLSTIRSADLFDSIVASLLASCGFTVTYIGGFKLSCRDILATEEDYNYTLVCECTTGSPRDKIGPMKSVLSNLSTETSVTTFVGVVITSQSISDAERRDAAADNIVIKDGSDLRLLLEIAQGPPIPQRVYEWLGIEMNND